MSGTICPLLHADDGDHQGELAELGQIDGGEQADPVAVLEQIETGYTDRKREATRKRAAAPATINSQIMHGIGDHHPQGHKEQGDEKIPDVDDLADDIQVVGKGGDGHPGNQGAHFHGQPEITGQAAHEEAPPQGGHQDQFRQLGDLSKNVAEHVFAQGRLMTTSKAPLAEDHKMTSTWGRPGRIANPVTRWPRYPETPGHPG